MLNLGHLIRTHSQALAASCVLTESAHAPATAAYRDFLRTVGGSPLLQREFVIFTNLQRTGQSPALIREYVEANLRQLQGHTIGELRRAHAGLAAPGGTPSAPAPLLEAIQTLICETVAPAGGQRVNAYYEALQLVSESLARPAVGHGAEVPHDDEGFTLPQLLSGAVGPLSETLQQLSEGEREVLHLILGADESAKQALFENYHRQALTLVADYPDSAAYERLHGMHYDRQTINEDLVDLHVLLQPD